MFFAAITYFRPDRELQDGSGFVIITADELSHQGIINIKWVRSLKKMQTFIALRDTLSVHKSRIQPFI